MPLFVFRRIHGETLVVPLVAGAPREDENDEQHQQRLARIRAFLDGGEDDDEQETRWAEHAAEMLVAHSLLRPEE